MCLDQEMHTGKKKRVEKRSREELEGVEEDGGSQEKRFSSTYHLHRKESLSN